MDIINGIFSGKKTDGKKLLSYGFEKQSETYIMNIAMTESGFSLHINITPPCGVTAEVYDDIGEPYTLHLVESAVGGFVGSVRAEYEKLLKEVAENCFTSDIFKARQSQLAAEYARITYGDELEFLWEKFPDCAVLRRKDNRKWYAAILTAAASKFGLDSTEKIEILDIRVSPENLPEIIDNVSFFAGYHMNKKHWLTILLNGSVDINTIYKYIDNSFLLAKK